MMRDSPIPTAVQPDPWEAMPLCCRYFSVHFDQQSVQVLAVDGASRELTATWALGALRDGDWEVLGAWPMLAIGPAFWQGVFDELTVRGVQDISVVLADADSDLLAACPRVAVLPPFGRILSRSHASVTAGAGLFCAEARRAVREAASVRGARAALERLLARSAAGRVAELAPDWPDALMQFEAFYALPPRRRVVVRRGDEAAEHLGRTLSRAVGRHGAFADLAAATSFVAQTLAHAERRLKASAIVDLDVSAHRAAPSAAGQGVVARGFRASSGGRSS